MMLNTVCYQQVDWGTRRPQKTGYIISTKMPQIQASGPQPTYPVLGYFRDYEGASNAMVHHTDIAMYRLVEGRVTTLGELMGWFK